MLLFAVGALILGMFAGAGLVKWLNDRRWNQKRRKGSQ